MRQKRETGPFKKIVRVLAAGSTKLERSRVLLECGHERYTDAKTIARCPVCKKPRRMTPTQGRLLRVDPASGRKVQRTSVFITRQLEAKADVRRNRRLERIGRLDMAHVMIFRTGREKRPLLHQRIKVGDGAAMNWVCEQIQAKLAELDSTVLLIDAE